MIDNIIKGPVTSILGLLIISLTTFSVYMGKIDWIWQGAAGCGVGVVLIFMKDKIVDLISSIVKSLIDKNVPKP